MVPPLNVARLLVDLDRSKHPVFAQGHHECRERLAFVPSGTDQGAPRAPAVPLGETWVLVPAPRAVPISGCSSKN